MENIRRKNIVEHGYGELSSFYDGCALLSGGDISVEVVDDTYEVEADTFNLSFCVNDNLFEIRNIDVRGNAGIGSKVLQEVHRFADEQDLSVVASNVKDTARGFWMRMGYQEGQEEGEFFKA